MMRGHKNNTNSILSIKFLFYILTLLTSLISMSIQPIAQAQDLNTTDKVLKSASELDYPPFAIVNKDGTAGGFSVDLLTAATSAVGLSVSFKVAPWIEIKQQLAERSIDVLPLVSDSKERDEMFDFSTTYLRLNGTVFVRKDDTTIKNLSDLNTKRCW